MTQAEIEPEPDYTVYRTKRPTPLQERFPEWITDKTGYDPSAAKSKQEAFEEGVRLATSLRMQFQASPENREATARLRAAREAAAAAEPETTPAPVPVPATRGRKPKAAPAPAESPATPAPASAPRGRRRATAAAAPAAF